MTKWTHFALAIVGALTLWVILMVLVLTTAPRNHRDSLRCIKGVACRTAFPSHRNIAKLRRDLLRTVHR